MTGFGDGRGDKYGGRVFMILSDIHIVKDKAEIY